MIKEMVMQQQGVVSLWMGQADSADSLDAYLNIEYSENGDCVPSSFAKNFAIRYYDDDFREAQYYDESSRSVSDLLSGYSYDVVIVPKFIQTIGRLLPIDVNAVVLLYNFMYDTGIEAISDGPVKLKYMGTVSLS